MDKVIITTSVGTFEVRQHTNDVLVCEQTRGKILLQIPNTQVWNKDAIIAGIEASNLKTNKKETQTITDGIVDGYSPLEDITKALTKIASLTEVSIYGTNKDKGFITSRIKQIINKLPEVFVGSF